MSTIKRRDSSGVSRLLLRGANPNARDIRGDGKSALSLAVSVGADSIARLLLKHGANPNLYAATGFTPLLEALQRDNPAMAKLLLAHGANPNARWADMTATHYAVLFLRSTSSRSDVLRAMLLAGADANQVEPGVGHVLLFAVEQEDDNLKLALALTRLLLIAGANPNGKDADGRTALEVAKTPEMRQLLKTAGGIDYGALR